MVEASTEDAAWQSPITAVERLLSGGR